MTNASLARKLERRQRGPRAAAQFGAYGGSLERAALSALDVLAEEQDRRRENLAERLLEIFAEQADPFQFVDTRRTEPKKTKDGEAYETEHASLTVTEWGVKLAEAALAAATVLYPEVPDISGSTKATYIGPVHDLPADAAEGVQSVAPDPNSATKRGAE